MKKESIATFHGKIDGDSDPRLVIKGDYLYAENVYNGDKSVPGAMVNDKGASLVSYTLPAGDNEVIGSAEDKRGNSLVYFIKNSDSNHRIVRWFFKENVIREVAAGEYLNFNFRIHSAHVVDGRFLVWTDGHSDGSVTPLKAGGFAHTGIETIDGNEIRKLDMLKSQVSGKVLIYELYAGQADNGQFADLLEYNFFVKNLAGTFTYDSAALVADGTYLNDPAAGLQWLADMLEGFLGDYVNVVVCDCKLVITMSSTALKLELESTDPQLILVPENHYASVLTDMKDWMIALAKQPATCAPEPTYIGVPDVAYNNVRDGCFQFRTRFVFENGELSSYSAVSVTPLNNAQLGGPQQGLNAIEIDFTDDRLNDPQWLSTIKYVELVFRDGNTSEFRLIKRIPVCEIGSVQQKFIFKNDQLYSSVASDDLSVTDLSVQVLTNFHNVPRLANSLAPIAATDGNLRLVTGGVLEGYDCPDCIEATATPTTYGNDDLVDIRGIVQIFNDARADDTVMRFDNYNLDGFVVYLAGTDYYAISDNPSDGSGTGEFIIRNVPRGVYSLRVASYMCRFDDSLGPRYNLQNGREWQRTSSPCVEVCGSLSYHGTDFWGEREVNLYGFIGSQFDLQSEPGYGDIFIQNPHNVNAAAPGAGVIHLLEVHCIDNNGVYGTLEERLQAIAVERIAVQFWQYDTNGETPQNGQVCKADHNGYAYACVNTVGPDLVTWKPVIPQWDGVATEHTPEPYAVYAAQVADATQNSGWLMITSDAAEDKETVTEDIIPIGFPITSVHAFCFQHDPDWSLEQKQTISGRVIDANGIGVDGALVWMVTNGRPEYTNAFGEFAFIHYGDDSPVRTAGQVIHVTYPPDVGGLYQPTPATDGATYNIDDDSDGVADPYTTPDFVFGFDGGVVFNGRFLKSGGMYGVGIVYEDDINRNCGVVPIDNVRIPFHTADGLYTPRSINWSINSLPPVWAKKYRIVRTKDSFYLTYRQAPVREVKYAIINDGALVPTLTTYSNNNATHILLFISAKLEDAELPSGTTLFMFRAPRKDGYRAKDGDRVRYMLDDLQNPLFSDRVLDVPVLGEYLEDENYAVVIPYSEINREVLKGFVFEFFTPKGVEEQIYYETGVCLEIGDAGTENRYHKGIYQDQDPDIDQPATGPIQSGDTYWWREQFVFTDDFSVDIVTEHYRRSVYHTEPCEDIGRAFAYDPNGMESFFDTRLRISGLYASNTQVNDLNAFGLLDYQTLNRSFGPIKWVGMVGNVLLAICQNKYQSVYVGKGRVFDLSGNSLVGRVDEILTIADEGIADAGTLHPESVVSRNGQAFWWDLQNGTVWRYAQDGATDIGMGRVKYFRARQEERMPIPDRALDVVIGGYDPKHDLYMLSFQAYDGGEISPVDALQDTLGFDVKNGGWRSHYTWYPQCFGCLNEDFVTFFSGAFYRMFRNPVYNFIVSQHESTVTIPFNEEPFVMKDWFYIRVRANKLWYAPLITTVPDAEYVTGMESVLLPNRWTLAEGVHRAEFLRDALDPHAEFLALSPLNVRKATAMLNGRRLKGDCLRVTLQSNVPEEYNILFASTVCYGDSQIT